MQPEDTFADFVEHPRYGRGPRLTGLNPETDYGGNIFLHWHSPKESRISNTAIVADISRQTPATVPVTHYFDVSRKCRDCGRAFIFFADEQRHWYEELGFPLESDCVRCFPCRKREHGIALARERYEELFHVPDKTAEEHLQMAECCLALIEAKTFHPRQVERVRNMLKKVRDDDQAREAVPTLMARVKQIEKSAANNPSQAAPKASEGKISRRLPSQIDIQGWISGIQPYPFFERLVEAPGLLLLRAKNPRCEYQGLHVALSEQRRANFARDLARLRGGELPKLEYKTSHPDGRSWFKLYTSGVEFGNWSALSITLDNSIRDGEVWVRFAPAFSVFLKSNASALSHLEDALSNSPSGGRKSELKLFREEKPAAEPQHFWFWNW